MPAKSLVQVGSFEELTYDFEDPTLQTCDSTPTFTCSILYKHAQGLTQGGMCVGERENARASKRQASKRESARARDLPESGKAATECFQVRGSSLPSCLCQSCMREKVRIVVHLQRMKVWCSLKFQ